MGKYLECFGFGFLVYLRTFFDIMKKLKDTLDLSDNLYYLEQIGSIEDQLYFLDNLPLTSCQLCYDDLHSLSFLNACVTFVKDNVIYSKLIVIYPSIGRRYFGGKYIVDIQAWLRNKNFDIINTVVNYEKKKN